MPLVSPQSADLQLEEVDFWEVIVSFARVFFGILTPSLLLLLSSCTLDHLFVIITDVYMSCHVIEIELQPPLSYGFLNALAIGRVAGRAGASLPLVDEAADLIRGASRVLLAGAEAVHSGLAGNNSPLTRDREIAFVQLRGLVPSSATTTATTTTIRAVDALVSKVFDRGGAAGDRGTMTTTMVMVMMKMTATAR